MSQKVCMSCSHAVEHELPAGAASLLIGQAKPRICIRNPPAPMAFSAGPSGGVVIAAVYPPVTKDTISCGEFKTRPASAYQPAYQPDH